MTDSIASIGQAEISFFETATLPLLNRSNPLTNLSVPMIESVYGPMASEVQERRMTAFLYIATAVCIGLLIGTEFAVSVFINPVLRKLDDRTQAKAVSLFAARLGRAMPFWYGLSLLLLLIEAIVARHEPGNPLLLAACAIWLTVIVLSLLFLVPINNRMMQLDARSFPEEAQREHRKWTILHHLRVTALVVAMICFLLAAHR